jgi:hypothetical protein
MKNLNYIPLDVPPPREIPETEKHLRDRKEKQMKMKELVRDIIKIIINL